MKKTIGILTVATLSLGAASAANASTYTLDVVDWSPIQFFSFGDASTNPIFQIDLGAGTTITGVDYDLIVIAEAPAWMNDIRIAFTPVELVPDGGPGLFLNPAVGNNGQGTVHVTGSVDLLDAGTPDPFVLPSGVLWVEGYTQFAGDAGLNVNGTITIHYSSIPAPGALALLGLAGLAGTSRRRRA